MALKEFRIDITTDASGDSTDTSGLPILGKLYAVDVVDGSLADNFDITLTYTSPAAVSKTLLTLTNLSADATYYPREQVHGNTGTGLTYTDDADIVAEMPLVAGVVTCTTGDGGNAKSGSVILYIEV